LTVKIIGTLIVVEVTCEAVFDDSGFRVRHVAVNDERKDLAIAPQYPFKGGILASGALENVSRGKQYISIPQPPGELGSNWHIRSVKKVDGPSAGGRVNYGSPHAFIALMTDTVRS
jgi:hypothetical protein